MFLLIPLYFMLLFNSLNHSIPSVPKEINRLFPIENYPQDISIIFNNNTPGYKKILLPKKIQDNYFSQLKSNYYNIHNSILSPWNPNILKHNILNKRIIYTINSYASKVSLHSNDPLYKLNFRKYDLNWFKKVEYNINIEQFKSLKYIYNNRAILTNNVLLQNIPYDNPVFESYKKPGSGYPFNLVYETSLYAGTPVYIAGESINKKWYFIVAPTYSGWVLSKSVSRVNNTFIKIWQTEINKNIATIIKTGLSIIDTKGIFRFTGYVGTMLPLLKSSNSSLVSLMIPVRDENGNAIIKYANLKKQDIAIMPLPITMENFVKITSTLLGRPYGWGNISYYNDCSSEIMYIYRIFGIPLPRNADQQATQIGININLNNSSPEVRYEALKEKGIPLLSLIYINGHIMIYLGEHKYKNNNELMTYQNIWGLSPKSRNRRDIIGESVIFPLKLKYNDDPDIRSELNYDSFHIILINKMIDNSSVVEN